MRCLVVYYSLSGNTRKVAELAAGELGADVAEVQAPRYGSGGFRFLRAAFDSWRGRLPAIEASDERPEHYDFVLLMSPVWAGHAATPIRAYLAQHRGMFKSAAFLLTCGGWCPPRAFEEMTVLSGIAPEATFTLREQEIKGSSELPPALASFLTSILPSPVAPVPP
jgi:Flavodoxin